MIAHNKKIHLGMTINILFHVILYFTKNTFWDLKINKNKHAYVLLKKYCRYGNTVNEGIQNERMYDQNIQRQNTK